jgi:hypothetical protein
LLKILPLEKKTEEKWFRDFPKYLLHSKPEENVHGLGIFIQGLTSEMKIHFYDEGIFNV